MPSYDSPAGTPADTPAGTPAGAPAGTPADAPTLLQRAVSYLEFEASLAGNVVPLELASPVGARADHAGSSGGNGGDQTNTTEGITENNTATNTNSPDESTAETMDVSQDVSSAYRPYEQLRAAIPADSPLHAMQTLEEVERYVAENVLIPLDQSRLNPVFGVGNPSADLLVIGEAPGADEDKKGEPFVGRAGQLLDKILQAIGFARNDVYIANILKSRPPNNRNPSPIEVAAHLPLLLKQIMLIQPKLILCVGRTAGTSLLGVESSLAALRGRFHDFHGVPVMVTYHPAALLRNPKWKPATWEDVQALRARYDELT